MAFLQCNFKSDALGRGCSMNVILPQGEGRKNYPVLYLLHGLTDDHTTWCRRSSIERYADALNLAVIMPDGGRGFYSDMIEGDAWWTFLSEELPKISASLFPISEKREETFAAGLSMGGYGALKLALRYPERFAAAVGLSSVVDIRARWQADINSDWRPELKRIFGSPEELLPRGNDLFDLASKTAKMPDPPRILTVCGTDDFMYQDNLNFRNHMRQLPYPGYEYREYPGNHCWEFWDEHIQEGLKFLFTHHTIA